MWQWNIFVKWWRWSHKTWQLLWVKVNAQNRWLLWSAYKEFSKSYISNPFFYSPCSGGGNRNETPVWNCAVQYTQLCNKCDNCEASGCGFLKIYIMFWPQTMASDQRTRPDLLWSGVPVSSNTSQKFCHTCPKLWLKWKQVMVISWFPGINLVILVSTPCCKCIVPRMEYHLKYQTQQSLNWKFVSAMIHLMISAILHRGGYHER